MLSILGELIESRYVAESITTDAGCFSHVGLCQMCTKLLTKAYVAETFCISCYWFCHVSAHDQFARYVRSNCWIILLEEKLYTLLSCWDTLTMCYTHQMKGRNHLDCKFVRCTHTLCIQTITNNSWWFKECICSSHSGFTLAMCMYTCSPSPLGHTGQHSPNVLLHLGTPLQDISHHVKGAKAYAYNNPLCIQQTEHHDCHGWTFFDLSD